MTTEEFAKLIPLSSGCSIISTHECGLIAINKKAGRSSHPNANARASAKPPMVRAAYNYNDEYYSWQAEEGGEKLHLYLINRLDSPTSGVVLAATNKECADAAKLAFKEKSVSKVYYAVCVGRLFPKFGRWIDNLMFVRDKNYVRSVSDPLLGKKAVTDYTVDSFDDNNAGLSLIRLEPTTGITHQLRVQCARKNIPILGDATYGNFPFNKKMRAASKLNRLFLHCAETKLEIESNGKKIEFHAEAPLPESFDKVIRFNNDIAKKFRLTL